MSGRTETGGRNRVPPAERVRLRLERSQGPDAARRLPMGYQRLGQVLLVRLPEDLRPHFVEIGGLWQEELGVHTVLRIQGPVSGPERTPRVELLAGAVTETEVVEYGVRYRLDAARVLFARGNRTERHRFGQLVEPGEVVTDLFAGVGYFSVPAAMHGASRVFATEVNPVAFHYLETNARLNGVADRIVAILGDNRAVCPPPGVADRVLLGILPSSLAWGPLAVRCLKPAGGWLHFHLVADVRDPPSTTLDHVRAAVGVAKVRRATTRTVKPYGPGREHRVVDAYVTVAE